MFKKEKLLISAITLSVLGVSIHGRLFASEENFIKQHYSLNKELYSCICTVFNEHIRQKSNTCKNYWANKLKWKGSIDALKKITTLSHQIDDTGYKAISQSYKGTINKLIQEITKAKKENTHYKENLNKMKALFNGWGAFEIIKMFWTLPNLNYYRDGDKRIELYQTVCDRLAVQFGSSIRPFMGIKKSEKENSESSQNAQNGLNPLEELNKFHECELTVSFVHDMQCYLEQFWVICNKVIEKTEHESIIAKVRRDFPPNAQKSKDWNYGVTREFSQKITDPSSMQNAVLQSIVHIAPLASKFNKYYRRGVFVKNEKGDREKVNVGKTAEHLFEITNAVWSDYEAGKSINAKVDLKQKNDNDPIEFFNSLLDKLHSDLSPNIYGRTNDQPPAPQIIECKENENDIIQNQFEGYCHGFKNNNNTVISDLFYVTCLKWKNKNKFQFISKETLTVPIAKVHKYNLERKKYDEITTNTITLDDFFKYFKDRECTELTVVPDILTFCVDWENLTDNLPSFSPEFSLIAREYINSVIQNEYGYGDDTNATYFLAGIVTKDENTEKFVYYNRMSENMSWYQYTEKEVTKVKNEASVQKVILKNKGTSSKKPTEEKNKAIDEKNKAIEEAIQKNKKPYILIYQRRPDVNKVINNNIMINSNNNINHVFRTQKKPNFVAFSVKNNNANSNINLENKNNNILQNNNMNNFNNLNNNINMNYNIQNMNTFQNNQNLGNMNAINSQNNQFFYPSMNNQFVANSNNFALQNYNVNNQFYNGNYNNQINNMNSQPQNGYGMNPNNNNIFNVSQNNINSGYNSTNMFSDLSWYEKNQKQFENSWFEILKTLENDNKTQVALGNIGATCYMNATLQNLARVAKEMISYLFTKKMTDAEFANNPNIEFDEKKDSFRPKYPQVLDKYQLTRSFTRMAMNLFKPQNVISSELNDDMVIDEKNAANNGSNPYYKPYDFKETISKMNPLFAGAQASDAKDLVNFILMTMHEELNLGKKENYQNFGNSNNFQTNQNAMRAKFLEIFNEENKSIISKLFYGTSHSETTCSNCKTLGRLSKHNYEAFSFLVFPLEEVRTYTLDYAMKLQYCATITTNQNLLFTANNIINKVNSYSGGYVDLYQCFDFNQKIEHLTDENSMYCDVCKMQLPATFQTKIDTGPEILIIILNRGVGIQYKVKLKFWEIIDLSNYIENKQSGCKYELVGTVTHMGESGASGHFIANCKDSAKRWWKYNDDLISPIKNFQTEIVNYAMPYILFYKKIH